MNEKKLTDEEIAKAIMQSIEYSKTITYFDEWGNCKSIMMTDVIDLINRLKEGRKTFFRIAKQRNEEKRELQKQVDELKKSQVIECHGMLKGCDMVKQAVKDTAKEIYAQVLEWSPVGEDYHCFITNLENWLKERYGVEVE